MNLGISQYKIARSRDMLLFCVKFRKLNISSAIVPTNLSIIDTLLGIVKLTIKLILLDLKPKRQTMPTYIQVLQLLRRSSSGLKYMFLLEALI